MNKFILLFFFCILLNQNLFASKFEKFSVSCATEKQLETGRKYGYSDKYIIEEWMNGSPYLFDGKNVYMKGWRSGWIKMKMSQKDNKIYWSRYSNALETDMNSVLYLDKMEMTTEYDDEDYVQLKSFCLKNSWNRGVVLANKVAEKK